MNYRNYVLIGHCHKLYAKSNGRKLEFKMKHLTVSIGQTYEYLTLSCNLSGEAGMYQGV